MIASGKKQLASVALAVCTSGLLHAQSPATPLAFETASIKLAPPDAQWVGGNYMLPIAPQSPPRGLLTMTVPLKLCISFAYGVHDEVEIRSFVARLPEWAQHQLYTIVARAPQSSPTPDQLRLMMRSLLEERFALKVHRETHSGTVNRLLLIKSGVTGPDLHPHNAASACEEQTARPDMKPPDPAKPSPVFCGWQVYTTAGGLLHIGMVGVTLAQAAGQFSAVGGMAGGRGMEPVLDATGLPGEWDMTLEFQPEWRNPGTAPAESGGGPTFTGALEKQLGLHLQRGTGPVEELIVDHIAEPTPD